MEKKDRWTTDGQAMVEAGWRPLLSGQEGLKQVHLQRGEAESDMQWEHCEVGCSATSVKVPLPHAMN